MFVESASGDRYVADLERGVEIGIRVEFDGAQPNAFGAPRARAEPLKMGSYLLDTRQGGSCNVQTLTITPHCNGTHTESILHIVDEGPTVLDVAPIRPIGATLVTVSPVFGSETNESYLPEKRPSDQLITSDSLESLAATPEVFLEAVVIRTLPNSPEKMMRKYGEFPGPYLSLEAVTRLAEAGVAHLLVDMASVDRADDDGRMRVHHIWFGVADGAKRVSRESAIQRTITEMVYVPNEFEDGSCILSLHVAPFASDAAPSRPILFPVRTP